MPAFTISDAARHCGVDRRTLQRAIRSGRLLLTPDHHLTPEALAQAGYGPAAVSQGRGAGAPRVYAVLLPQGQAPQDPPQELAQATALLALLERLTTAIMTLHEDVCALREDLRRRVRRVPQGTSRETPQPVRHAAGAPQGRAAPQPQVTPQPAPRTGAAIPLTGARGNLRRRIVALLQEHPEGLTPAEMRIRLGVDKRLAATCLGMRRDGLLRRVGRGRYVAAES